MTTFITFIGKGKKLKDQQFGYEETQYSFDGKIVSRSCFANAVLASGQYSFDRLCIIGTSGSSWSQLLENPASEEEDLYLQLFEAQDHPEQLQTLFPALQAALVKRWQIGQITLLANSAVLLNHEEEILTRYLELLQSVEGDIVLDVTHSFRWMPLFLTSALQLAEALSAEKNIRILYGELSSGKTQPSPVRQLDSLWRNRKLAADIQLFFEKWEGGPLAKEMRPYWPQGADALLSLSSHLQGNFILPLVLNPDNEHLGIPLQQLGNALKAFPEPAPLWLKSVAQQLKNFLEKFTHLASAAERLACLAGLYAERKMYGQALICQECCLRMFLWAQQHGKCYPDWDDLQTALDEYKKGRKLPNVFWAILNNRNTVAHGALHSKNKAGGIPQVVNLPTQFERQNEYLKRLLAGKA